MPQVVCFLAGVAWAACCRSRDDEDPQRTRCFFFLRVMRSLAPLSGIGWADIGWSVAIAAGVLLGMFVYVRARLDRRRRRQARGRDRIVARGGSRSRLCSLYGVVRRHPDDRFSSVSVMAIAGTMSYRALDHAAACTGDRRSLRGCDCIGGAFYLPGDTLDESAGLTWRRTVEFPSLIKDGVFDHASCHHPLVAIGAGGLAGWLVLSAGHVKPRLRPPRRL